MRLTRQQTHTHAHTNFREPLNAYASVVRIRTRIRICHERMRRMLTYEAGEQSDFRETLNAYASVVRIRIRICH